MPLPDNLRGGAAAKMVGALIAKGFLEEVDADPRKGELLWRETGDGHGVTLVATAAGFAVIGIKPKDTTSLRAQRVRPPKTPCQTLPARPRRTRRARAQSRRC